MPLDVSLELAYDLYQCIYIKNTVFSTKIKQKLKRLNNIGKKKFGS